MCGSMLVAVWDEEEKMLSDGAVMEWCVVEDGRIVL